LRMSNAVPTQFSFQYPRLDRRVENRIQQVEDCPGAAVSVSTTGSKGRKRRITMSRRRLRPVSVSTTGSKGRKRDAAWSAAWPAAGFSIHDWIEGSKTPNPTPPLRPE